MHELGFLEPIVRKVGFFELVQLPICVAALALAFARPSLAASAFGKIEVFLSRLAARPYVSALLIAAVAIAFRAIFIPLMTVEPLVPDELSLRLQADTYLHGRLANPAIHSSDFTSIYTLLEPSYASMYPVLRSLPLVIGRLVGLDFWAGAWFTVIALCVTTYWALRAYVSPPYAMAAALIVVARMSIFSVWVNSYFGAALTAIGGLLLIGGYARLVREPNWKSGFMVGAGVFLLMTTRPFEGLVFSIPAAIGLIVHFVRSPTRRRSLVAPGLVAAGLVVAGLALTTVHNQAVTGDWRKAPYELYREVSGGGPAFLFASPTRGGEPAPIHARSQRIRQRSQELFRRADAPRPRGNRSVTFRAILEFLYWFCLYDRIYIGIIWFAPSFNDSNGFGAVGGWTGDGDVRLAAICGAGIRCRHGLHRTWATNLTALGAWR